MGGGRGAGGRAGATTVCCSASSSAGVRRGTPLVSGAMSIVAGGVDSTAFPFRVPRYLARSPRTCSSTMTACATWRPSVPRVCDSGYPTIGW